MTDKKFRVLNLVLFSFILLFSLTKYLFPVVIVPIGWIPFIENPLWVFTTDYYSIFYR